MLKTLKEFNKTKETRITESGLQISKELDLHSTTFPHGKFIVDDISKKFAIYYIQSVKTKNIFKMYNYSIELRVWKYSDLGAFELVEDGNSIQQGKGVATAVGAMTFGLAGALMGSSGKRKTENTCTALGVRMFVNDLQNPLIECNFVSSEVNKKSPLYRDALSKATNLMSVLSYISTNSK